MESDLKETFQILSKDNRMTLEDFKKFLLLQEINILDFDRFINRLEKEIKICIKDSLSLEEFLEIVDYLFGEEDSDYKSYLNQIKKLDEEQLNKFLTDNAKNCEFLASKIREL